MGRTQSLRTYLLLLLLGVLGALPARAALAQDDELVGEFRRHFKKFKDTPARVEAVLALQGSESRGAVEVLLAVLADPDPQVAQAAVRVLSTFTTPDPVAEVFARLAVEKREAVRSGLLTAIATGRYAGPSEALVACLSDKGWEVRRQAARALAATGASGAASALLPLCKDSEAAVRSAALESLAELRAREVIDPAIAALEDPVWQVRASAAKALGVVRDKRSIGPLIARMEREEGRLLIDIGTALEEITGRLLDQRADQWRRFWNDYSERFEIPTDEEMAKLRQKRAESKARYAGPNSTTYHGIDTPSRSIVFIIDVSGSMESLVVERERFKDGNYPSFSRMDIVKTELARTIERLEPYVKFNILSFATDVKPWKKTLVAANVLNKRGALDWVGKLQPIGGTSKEELASVGLVASANLEAGKTNSFGALMEGLRAGTRSGTDSAYAIDIDTIFFLSDGRPTDGELVDPDDILREVRRVNELRKVVIHTIAIGEFQKEFMRRLALENGGVFVDLGK